MDWNQQKVVDLRTELKRRGLPHSGLKADLIARLKTSDAEKLQTNGSPKCEAEAESQPEPTSATANPTTSNSPKEPPDVDVERLQAINPPETVESESQSAILQEAKHVAAPELALTDHLNDPGTSITTDPPQQQADVKQADAERSTEQTSPTLHAEAIDEPDSAARQIDVEVSLPTDNLDSSMRDLPPPEKVDREPTTESLQQDSQKRKRRSITPPPSPTLSANKRQKTSLEVGKPPPEAAASSNMVIDNTEENLLSRSSHAVSSGLADSLPPAQDAFTKQSTSRHEVSLTSHIPSNMVLEREVVPSLHPATEALYIRNFMRPLRALDVKSYLASLATALEATEPEDIIDFHLDHIRTHAFVLFSNISAASRVRTALHDKVWPEEVNRKPLWVDFIPAEKVREWIDEEESSRASSSTTNHFVVLYEDDGFGSVTPRLASSSSAAAKGAPTSGPSGGRGPPTPTTMMPPPKEPRIVNAVPTGPRSLRRFGVDFQQQALDGSGLDIPPPRGPAHKEAGGEVKYTTARPGVSWQPVSPELAQARLQDMRSYYTKEVDRDMGPESEINRYTFEGKYRFVDRGREMFVGIRPPHRERDRQRQTGYGGGRDRDARGRYGGGGGRFGGGPKRRRRGRGRDMQVDSYYPGHNDYSRDDRSRYDDNRHRDPDDDRRRKDYSPIRDHDERRRDRDD